MSGLEVTLSLLTGDKGELRTPSRFHQAWKDHLLLGEMPVHTGAEEWTVYQQLISHTCNRNMRDGDM